MGGAPRCSRLPAGSDWLGAVKVQDVEAGLFTREEPAQSTPRKWPRRRVSQTGQCRPGMRGSAGAEGSAWVKAWGPGQPGTSPGLQRRGPGLQRGHGLLPRGPGPGDAAEAAATSSDQQRPALGQGHTEGEAFQGKAHPADPWEASPQAGHSPRRQDLSPASRASEEGHMPQQRMQRPAASPAARAAGVADQEAAGRQVRPGPSSQPHFPEAPSCPRAQSQALSAQTTEPQAVRQGLPRPPPGARAQPSICTWPGVGGSAHQPLHRGPASPPAPTRCCSMRCLLAHCTAGGPRRWTPG